MARLTILTQDKIDSLYSIPRLDDEERSFLFSPDSDDLAYLDTLENNTAYKINYILQLGYYRAINIFFQFSFQKVKADVEFIRLHYFPNQPFPKKQISKKNHYLNRDQVMAKYNLKNPDSVFQQRLLKQAKILAKSHSLSRFILEGLLSYCQQQNVIRPAYSSFQYIVSTALKEECNRLVNKMYTDAGKALRNELDKLLENDELFYNLILIKKDQKNFSTTEIKNSVAKQQLIIGIYDKSLALMPKLGISEQNIIYYANLAEFYTIQELKRFNNKNLVRLYLLCYVHRRLLKINDNLVSSLIQKVTLYDSKADEYQRSKIDIAEAVDKQLRNQAWQVMNINIDDHIPDNKVREKAFEVIPQDHYKQFLQDFKKPNMDRDFYRWEYYGHISLTIKKNIRPLFKVLEFSSSNDEMNQAVDFFRQHLSGKQSFQDYNYADIPLGFLPQSLKTHLTYKTKNDDQQSIKKVDGDRYECMVYKQLKRGIADGTVFIKDSHCYRALEDELIDVEYWAKHKQAILKQLNMPLLSINIVDLLNQLQSNLKDKYAQVNQHIHNGENPHLKIKYNTIQ